MCLDMSWYLMLLRYFDMFPLHHWQTCASQLCEQGKPPLLAGCRSAQLQCCPKQPRFEGNLCKLSCICSLCTWRRYFWVYPRQYGWILVYICIFPSLLASFHARWLHPFCVLMCIPASKTHTHSTGMKNPSHTLPALPSQRSRGRSCFPFGPAR